MKRLLAIALAMLPCLALAQTNRPVWWTGSQLLTVGGDGVSTSTITALTLTSTNTYGWDDLRITPSGLNPVGIADAATLVANSGPSGDQSALRFADGAVSVAAATYQLPHTWATNVNSTVYPHMHITPTTTATGTVVFVLSYAWANIHDAWPSSSVITNQFLISTNSQWKHLLWNLPTNGISGAGKVYSSCLDWSFRRVATDPDDNFAGDIDLKSADLHYLSAIYPVQYTP